MQLILNQNYLWTIFCAFHLELVVYIFSKLDIRPLWGEEWPYYHPSRSHSIAVQLYMHRISLNCKTVKLHYMLIKVLFLWKFVKSPKCERKTEEKLLCKSRSCTRYSVYTCHLGTSYTVKDNEGKLKNRDLHGLQECCISWKLF